MDRDALRALARDALDHLYQEPMLQQHPLAELVVPEASVAGRGVALRRALVDAIQQLRPPHSIAQVSPVWRRYRSLCQRHLEGKTFKQIAEGETISVRQAVRDYHQAFEGLLDAIWVTYWRGREAAPPGRELAPFTSATTQPEDTMGLEGELLRFSSRGSGGNRELTRLDELLTDALVVLQPLVRSMGSRIECGVPATLPPVTVDRSMLRQALLNILSYAVECSSGGRVAIAADGGAGRAELLITASGWRTPLGAVPEERARLAVTRRLVEVEGGRLEVLPDAGRGAAVRLVFSVAPSATVLVVDDNPDLARLFGRYLVGTNYHIVQATTGQHALELAGDLHPIAITLDLMMPSQDGWELLQNLLRDPATRGPPIVVCSVLPERALALALGASYFLDKPVTRDALLAVLTSCQSGDSREPAG